MKITYTKGRILFTVSFLVALLSLNFSALACVSPTLTATPTDMTCHGVPNGSVSLVATGGPGPYTYSWTSSTGFTSASANISGLDSGSYTVTVSVPGGCSSTTTVIVSEPAPLQVITSSNAPFCPGATLTLYTSTTGGTPAYSYSWTGPAGFTSTDSNPNIPMATAANNGVYSLTVTDVHSCATNNNFSVLLYPAPIVDLGPDAYICAGNNVVLDAGNIGSHYIWSSGATTQTITTNVPGIYYVTDTNFYSCYSSDTILLTASPYLIPTISIDATSNNICAGVTVTFSSTVTNEGTTPAYVWRKNGLVVGGSTATYTDAALNNNDFITCRLTSSFQCAAPTTAYSDTERMRVSPDSVTSVTISHLPDTACSGTPLTFTATPFNGGTSPYYEWIKAGVVAGTGNTFIYSPTAADTIIVRMVSSFTCHTPDTAADTSGFVIYPHIVPSAFISFTPNDTVSAIGAITTFFCSVTYGGSSPSYQWVVDNVPVPGATNSSYARHVYDDDLVKCVVTSSAICAVPRKDTSNVVKIYATFLGVDETNAGLGNISLFPNPTTGDFTLSGNVGIAANNELKIEVCDLKGSVVYRKAITSQNGSLNEQLSLGGQLADGVYLLRVTSDRGSKQLKLVINK